MKFGLMRDRITLQEYSATRDDWGHEVKQWTDVATVWAEKKYKNSSLVSEVQGLTHIMQITFKIRFMADVTTKMRVKEGTKFFDIVGMKMLGNQEALEIITIERDADSNS